MIAFLALVIGALLGLAGGLFIGLRKPELPILSDFNIAQQRFLGVCDFWEDQGRLPPPGSPITLNGVGEAYIFDTPAEPDDEGDDVVRVVYYISKRELKALDLDWETSSRDDIAPHVSSMAIERFLANVTENALDFARFMEAQPA